MRDGAANPKAVGKQFTEHRSGKPELSWLPDFLATDAMPRRWISATEIIDSEGIMVEKEDAGDARSVAPREKHSLCELLPESPGLPCLRGVPVLTENLRLGGKSRSR